MDQQSAVQSAARECIRGALAQKEVGVIVASRLAIIDKYLALDELPQAQDEKNSFLGSNVYKYQCPPPVDSVCNQRGAIWRAKIDHELATRFSEPLDSRFWWSTLFRWIPPLRRLWILIWHPILFILSILGIILLALLLWYLCAWLFRVLAVPVEPPASRWKVWAIADSSDSGAAGTVMEALDFRVNPLVQPFIREGQEGATARARRQLLLVPPMLESHDEDVRRQSALLWNDFLLTQTTLQINQRRDPETLIEYLPFDSKEDLPDFDTGESYEQGDIDLTFGGFRLAGILPLYRMLRRFYFRRYPSVVGFVNEQSTNSSDDSPSSGKNIWEVRLNARRPVTGGREDSDDVGSVWAESAASEHGDPLGVVAQRAAFKLVLRILTLHDDFPGNKDLTSSQITAIAAYRQGIQLLMQQI